jgi:hypothetical protein
LRPAWDHHATMNEFMWDVGIADGGHVSRERTGRRTAGSHAGATVALAESAGRYHGSHTVAPFVGSARHGSHRDGGARVRSLPLRWRLRAGSGRGVGPVCPPPVRHRPEFSGII